MRALLFIGAMGVFSGCKALRNDCGDYVYKGVIGTEWCGDVYGSEGQVFVNDDDPSTTWAQIEFRHTVPPGEFDFDHVGTVLAQVRWEDLDTKEPLGPESVWTRCIWTDFRDPRIDNDDIHHDEPAVEVELLGRGSGFNLDPGSTMVRDLEWHLDCGDGAIRLDAHDTIKFDVGSTSGLSPELTALLEGAEDTGL